MILSPPSTGPLNTAAPYGYLGHTGIDYGWYKAAPDLNIYAAGDGKFSSSWSDGYGNVGAIDHGKGVVSTYSHASAKWQVADGSTVKRGQVIGTMSDTGSKARGVHLHFMVIINGVRVNPLDALAQFAGNSQPISPSPHIEEHDMAQPFYYIASSNNVSVTVGVGDVWVRSQPGEPLRRLTSGQAADYFARDGLDYNSPNVVSRPGEWFDAAFAEDIIVHGYNVTTHPYMATGGTSIDAASITAIEVALRDEFAAIPDAVRQNIKNAL